MLARKGRAELFWAVLTVGDNVSEVSCVRPCVSVASCRGRARGRNYSCSSFPMACEVAASLWMRDCLGTTKPTQRMAKDEGLERRVWRVGGFRRIESAGMRGRNVLDTSAARRKGDLENVAVGAQKGRAVW